MQLCHRENDRGIAELSSEHTFKGDLKYSPETVKVKYKRYIHAESL